MNRAIPEASWLDDTEMRGSSLLGSLRSVLGSADSTAKIGEKPLAVRNGSSYEIVRRRIFCHDSKMSISPSLGQVNGCDGRSHRAGQIPGAQGAVRVAERQPRWRSSFWWLIRRALVYLFSGDGSTMPRSTSLLSGVKKQFFGSVV